MNRKLVIRLLGALLLIEAACMVPSCVIAFIYRDGDLRALVRSVALIVMVGVPMRTIPKPAHTRLRAREGYLVVGLGWVLLSVFGALPFVFSGVLPNFVDALFESVSGFTTTGASVLTQIDGQPHGVIFWRSFTHWVGGMGVLVLFLALLPKLTDHTSFLMRAESPGPTLSKILPKMSDTAKVLYLIYLFLTVLEFIALMLCGMNPFDAGIHAMGTAGTGGFSNYGASVAAFDSAAVDAVITVFMILFGCNFAVFFLVLTGGWREALHNEELHWYGGITLFCMLALTLMIIPVYGNFFTALRYGSFQTATILSTTGYATADFGTWPVMAQMTIFVMMFIGSCAGSTAGGIKVIRIALLVKQARREISVSFQPHKVQRVRFEHKGVEEKSLHAVAVYVFVYVVVVLLGAFLVALENRYDVITNLTASLTCVSNVGPGLGFVGPAENFAGYGPFAKSVLTLLMLAGRLELFPVLALFHPGVWRKS